MLQRSPGYSVSQCHLTFLWTIQNFNILGNGDENVASPMTGILAWAWRNTSTLAILAARMEFYKITFWGRPGVANSVRSAPPMLPRGKTTEEGHLGTEHWRRSHPPFNQVCRKTDLFLDVTVMLTNVLSGL